MYDSSLPPVPQMMPTPAAQKQSKIGIASFVLGICGILIFCIGILIAMGYGVYIGLENPYVTNPSALVDPSDPIILIASGFMYCSPVFSLIGLGLGIASAFQKNAKKTLGIIGLVLNVLTLLSFCAMIGLGLIADAGAMSF